MDPSVRPWIALVMAPLFVGLGLYLAMGKPLPGQTRILHRQLGISSIVMGIFTAAAALFAP